MVYILRNLYLLRYKKQQNNLNLYRHQKPIMLNKIHKPVVNSASKRDVTTSNLVQYKLEEPI